MRLTNIMAPALVAVAFGGAMVLGPLPSASAAQRGQPPLVPDQEISLCPGNSLSITDHTTGEPLSQAEIAAATRQIERLCEAGVGTTQTFEEYAASERSAAPVPQGLEYANVVAQILTRPGSMSIMGYANAVPINGRVHELSCIYRQQNVDGPGVPWESCGAASTTSSSMTTRGNEFCPVPGTRWESLASLYADDVWKQDDGAVAIAE
jgi:hypothetical protein